jgi:hypothetical protein
MQKAIFNLGRAVLTDRDPLSNSRSRREAGARNARQTAEYRTLNV